MDTLLIISGWTLFAIYIFFGERFPKRKYAKGGIIESKNEISTDALDDEITELQKERTAMLHFEAKLKNKYELINDINRVNKRIEKLETDFLNNKSESELTETEKRIMHRSINRTRLDPDLLAEDMERERSERKENLNKFDAVTEINRLWPVNELVSQVVWDRQKTFSLNHHNGFYAKIEPFGRDMHKMYKILIVDGIYMTTFNGVLMFDEIEDIFLNKKVIGINYETNTIKVVTSVDSLVRGDE